MGFRNAIAGLILANAFIIGLQTYHEIDERYGPILAAIDLVILVIFSGEIALRFLTTEPRSAFFRDHWNLFDIVVVGASFVPTSSYLVVARLLRLLRVLRTVEVLPSLRKLAIALGHSLRAVGHILVLLALVLYVYGAIGYYLFSPFDRVHFGTLHQSMLTLFTVLTLEKWVDIMSGVTAEPGFEWAWIYFVSFIVVGTFVLLNFFIGVVVTHLQSEEAADTDRARAQVRADIAEVRQALLRIEELLGRGPRP